MRGGDVCSEVLGANLPFEEDCEAHCRSYSKFTISGFFQLVDRASLLGLMLLSVDRIEALLRKIPHILGRERRSLIRSVTPFTRARMSRTRPVSSKILCASMYLGLNIHVRRQVSSAMLPVFISSTVFLKGLPSGLRIPSFLQTSMRSAYAPKRYHTARARAFTGRCQD